MSVDGDPVRMTTLMYSMLQTYKNLNMPLLLLFSVLIITIIIDQMYEVL